MRVKPGIEVLLGGNMDLVRESRVGVVVHPASVLPDLRHTADVLLEAAGCGLVSLFGPQHGARGEKQDNMIESEFYRDPDTGLPVHSLYSETRRPTREMMDGIDVLLFDLQDVGTRVYTFIHTMAYCMEACTEYEKKMVVLDRPNPIGGVHVEGILIPRTARSWPVSDSDAPRHECRELALFLNSEFEIGCDLGGENGRLGSCRLVRSDRTSWVQLHATCHPRFRNGLSRMVWWRERIFRKAEPPVAFRARGSTFHRQPALCGASE